MTKDENKIEGTLQTLGASLDIEQARKQELFKKYSKAKYLDVTLDPGFKRLLKNEAAMVRFLNAILHLDDKKKFPSNNKRDIAEREKRRYEIPYVYAIWICDFPINTKGNYRDVWQIYSENSIANNAPQPITEKIKYFTKQRQGTFGGASGFDNEYRRTDWAHRTRARGRSRK